MRVQNPMKSFIGILRLTDIISVTFVTMKLLTQDLYMTKYRLCVSYLLPKSRIQPAILNPIEAVSVNCVGTVTVLQCARREAGVKKGHLFLHFFGLWI